MNVLSAGLVAGFSGGEPLRALADELMKVRSTDELNTIQVTNKYSNMAQVAAHLVNDFAHNFRNQAELSSKLLGLRANALASTAIAHQYAEQYEKAKTMAENRNCLTAPPCIAAKYTVNAPSLSHFNVERVEAPKARNQSEQVKTITDSSDSDGDECSDSDF